MVTAAPIIRHDTGATARLRKHARRLFRFEHAIALLVCAIAPFVFQNWGLGIDSLDPQAINSASATFIAIVLGGWVLSRLSSLPGIQRSAGILPTYAIAFGIVVGTILVLRIPYTRWMLLYGFVTSLCWYYVVALFRREPLELGFVPGGWGERLSGLGGVRLHRLKPDSSVEALHAIAVDMRIDHSDYWEARLADFALAGVPIYNAKDLHESLTGRTDLEHLSENNLGGLGPLVAFQQIKSALDRMIAVPALVVFAPLLLITAIAIKLDSPGPAFFRQERMGFRGRIFKVYKFRTMRDVSSPEALVNQLMTQEGDERITRIGRFLRRCRIDELPQILNILRGEMSWIGPRPEAVGLSEWYQRELPFYRYRHIVYPGITGWAQVNQGHVTGIDDIRMKLQYDFYYIRNFSIWLDLVIIARTLLTMLSGFGHK